VWKDGIEVGECYIEGKSCALGLECGLPQRVERMHSRRQIDKAYMLQQCWKHTPSYHRASPLVLTGVTEKNKKQRWMRLDHQDMPSAFFVTFGPIYSGQEEEAVAGAASISTTK
jgi:hypothetical protein